MRKYSSISVQYVRVRLYLDEELDTQTPFLALIPTGQEEPESDEWESAIWLSDDAVITASSGTQWHYRDCGVLIGPGGHQLANGVWQVWWKLDAGVEKPAARVATIQVT